MKRRFFNGATAMMIACAVLFSSCIGSFGLTNKVFDWNKKVGDKWVNELVFFAACVVQVYSITIFIDGVVLNTIEFWTGDNPVAQIDQTVEGENGIYSIKSNDTGYTITEINTGAVTTLNYDSNNRTWSATIDGNTVDFLTFVDETHVKLYGSDDIIELSENGVMAYKQQLLNMYPDFAIAY